VLHLDLRSAAFGLTSARPRSRAKGVAGTHHSVAGIIRAAVPCHSQKFL
jgi:hypothetical protein